MNYTDKELIKKVAEDVVSKGGKAYYVGGYVRDKYLNKENKDIDVEVLGLSEKEYVEILATYGEVDFIGKSFGVFMLKGYDIDFSMARTERKTSDKHTGFEVNVEGVTLEEAYTRRDFTINALMEDIVTGEVTGSPLGLSDLSEGVIRYVNAETFLEDELRAYRACQFASRLNFSVDDDVIKLSRTFNYKHLSRERIEEELDKLLLKSEKPSVGLNYMSEMDIFEKSLPNLKFESNFGRVLDRTVGITKELNLSDDDKKALLYKILSTNGTLEDITNNKLLLKKISSIKVFDYTDMESLRKEVYNNTLELNLVYMVCLNLLTLEQKENVLFKVKEHNMVTYRVITGKDLQEKGYKQGKELGEKLQELLDLQMKGYTKEQLESLI